MSSCLKMVQAIAVLTSVVIGKAFLFSGAGWRLMSVTFPAAVRAEFGLII